MAAPLGNQNAAKGKLWRDAILRALETRGRLNRKEALDEIAEALIEKCLSGDVPALKELGDRMDGKAPAEINAHVSGNLISTLASLERSIPAGRATDDPPVA